MRDRVRFFIMLSLFFSYGSLHTEGFEEMASDAQSSEMPVASASDQVSNMPSAVSIGDMPLAPEPVDMPMVEESSPMSSMSAELMLTGMPLA